MLPLGAFVGTFIAENYADYLYFTDNLSFADLQETMADFSAEQQQALFQFLQPATAVDGYDWDNSLMYTTRLRLGIDAKVYDNVKFTGRLSMYKTWGDSTGVQVFNGQSNSFNIDGNTNVPNSDILRVERATSTGPTSAAATSTCRSAVAPRPVARRCTCATVSCAAAARWAR
jgi:hypothetical protein